MKFEFRNLDSPDKLNVVNMDFFRSSDGFLNCAVGMVSDIRIKKGILDYALKHEIYVPELFTYLFEKSGTLFFKRGETIKLRMDDLLCLIHSGAVMVDILMQDGHRERHISLQEQVFFAGLELKSINRKACVGTAVMPTELTFIRLSIIKNHITDEPEYWASLLRHVVNSDQEQSRIFHHIQNQPTLVSKVDEMLRFYPRILDVKQTHLAEYLMVRPPSLSRALKEWERQNFF